MPHQLTIEERDRIAQLRGQGANQQEIAQSADTFASHHQPRAAPQPHGR